MIGARQAGSCGGQLHPALLSFAKSSMTMSQLGQSPVTDLSRDLPDSAWPWIPPCVRLWPPDPGFPVILPHLWSVLHPSPSFPE